MYYSIHEFSKKLNKSPQTLRNWDKNGYLKPAYKSVNGYRYYTDDQLNFVLGIKPDRKVIGYCRVSSQKQKDDLDRQIMNMQNYMAIKGYQFEIITDIGSGINYNKKGLNQLITLVTENKVEKVIIMHKDRLVRFGYELIENLCKRYNTAIEIIDNTPKSEQEELVEDLVQIITVFSCKLQGKRANKMKKVIQELKGENI